MLSLDQLKINDKGIIKSINCDKLVATRLMDMGISRGEIIEYILKSPSKYIKAYLVKNTLIAIRDSDAQNIDVEVIDEKDCFNWKS